MDGSGTAGAVRLSSAAGRGVLLATVLGSGMAMLDSTVVNVALPHIGETFEADLSGLQWTITGYTLTLAAFILLGGSLGDRYGRRRVFLVGVVWFAVASALCGVALSMPMLILARALQGIGGALLTPGSLALIQATFHPDERAKTIGAWSGLGGVATAIGPFVGGWLVDAVDWRWVFYLNLPLAALVVLATLRYVPESRDPVGVAPFDFQGAGLGALGLAGMTYALVAAPDAGGSPLVLGVGAAGVLALAAFIMRQNRIPYPMLPPELFRSMTFSAINGVTFLVYGALGGLMFFVVVALQQVAGFSALAAGTAMLPFTVIMLIGSSASGALAQRIGPRLQLVVGPLLTAAGTLLLLRIGPGAGYLADVLPGVVLIGIGMTLLVAPLTATVLAAVEVSHAGVASGVNNAVARAAGLLAVAALPLVAGLSGASYQRAAVFERGFRIALVACAVLLGLAAMLSAVLLRRRPKPTDAPPERHVTCEMCPPLEHVDRAAADPAVTSEE